MQRYYTCFCLVASLFLAAGCAKSVAPAIVEQQAVLVGNAEPVDGCGAHLELNYVGSASYTGEYALPTDATRALFDKAVAAEEVKQVNGFWMGRKIVTIRYQRTANLGVLSCGRGKSTVTLVELMGLE